MTFLQSIGMAFGIIAGCAMPLLIGYTIYLVIVAVDEWFESEEK